MNQNSKKKIHNQIWISTALLTHTLQDITSEVPALQPGCNQEVIINCRQQQQHSQQPHQRPIAQSNISSSNTAAPATQQQPTANTGRTASTPTTCKCDSQKFITRSQSSKVIQDLQPHPLHQLKQQQSLPTPLHGHVGGSPNGHHHHHHHHNNHSKSVSILVYKTLNTVFKSSRKIIVRVCEVASVKKNFNMFKFNKASQQTRAEARANTCTGHDQFVRPPVSEK